MDPHLFKSKSKVGIKFSVSLTRKKKRTEINGIFHQSLITGHSLLIFHFQIFSEKEEKEKNTGFCVFAHYLINTHRKRAEVRSNKTVWRCSIRWGEISKYTCVYTQNIHSYMHICLPVII